MDVSGTFLPSIGFDPSARARLVAANSDVADEAECLAHLYASDAGGALRTLLGAAHRHPIGMFPSIKTGFNNPYEGTVEPALILESEVNPDVVDYQTQAFRLRVVVLGQTREWICDHLRQMVDGSIEAIEVKRTPADLTDIEYRSKLAAVREVCRRLGWRFRVLYEADIRGSASRQINIGHIAAHRSVHITPEQMSAFEALRAAAGSRTTFAALREALDNRRIQGKAAAHALIVRGRVSLNLDQLIHDTTIVKLRPEPRFTSRIRF